MDLDFSQLPEGWALTKITEVSAINPKFSNEGISDDTDVSFIPMRAVEELTGRIDLSLTREINEVKKGYTSFIDDDLLFAKITPCMENGKIAIVKGLKNGIGFGSTEFHVIRIAKLLNNKYFFYYVIQDTFRDYAKRNMQGTAGQLRVPLSFIQQIAIPLPPLAEQERIAAKVDELLAGVNAARERLAKVPGILKRFRQSVLAAACSGRLTADWREHQLELEPASRLVERILNGRHKSGLVSRRKKGKSNYKNVSKIYELPNSWTWTTIEVLLRDDRALSYGILKPGDHDPSGIPMLRVKDIGDGKLNKTDILHVSLSIAEQYERTKLEMGDILLAIMATVGRSMVVPPEMEGANVNRALAVIKLSKFINPHFVRLVIQSPYFQDIFASEKIGSAQARINLEDLRKFPLPLPPLEEQKEIVRRVEALFRLADAIEARVAAGANRAEKLTQAVLAQAFRGELVPTEAELARREGRDYEPAAVLLARIKEEKAKTAATQSQSRIPRKPQAKGL
jgi:type I restriction enzyme S subunit